MASSTLTNLRANAAMRDEDLRIAVKHTSEAAARPMTPDNASAYERAQAWEELCRDAAQAAHAKLIQAQVS